jgi:NADPH-dependent glutamate synthase beta subunit-like oxidoreductase/Pyruvate/2-oxoacid:ferredoxin oxidoreductase delta subunit
VVRINGTEYKAYETQTILDTAKANDIFIPCLCYGEGLEGVCGICVVEVEGRLVRACSSLVREGMDVKTDSPKVLESRRTVLELILSAHRGDCKAPCQTACPAQSDCRGYIALIAAGKLKEAAELMKDSHPFPASMARICLRYCEAQCRRGLVDEPVNIADLKRFAADYDLQNEPFVPQAAPSTRKSVAVAGGGPAGLTAAFFLRKAGHSVSVFEAMPKMGGSLRYAIPEYRLPKAVLDAEIKVLRSMGISFFNETEIGRDISLQFLQSRYDIVIMATGAAADTEDTLSGINFLKSVALDKPPIIGKCVTVIGGGDTAVDSARTALRLGAEAIVVFGGTRGEMSAQENEIEAAIAEGVQFKFLSEDGGDCIITAADESRNAIESIAYGRRLAQLVNSEQIVMRSTKTPDDFKEIPKKPRQNPVIHRGLDFGEVRTGFTPKEAAAEAERCLSCGCADYFECKLIKLANMYGADTAQFPEEFHKRPEYKVDKSNFYFHRDMNKCILCRQCVRVCENQAISTVNRGFDMTVSAAFGQPVQNRDECTLCGNCVARCPVGALVETSPLPKPLVTRGDITVSACTSCEKCCEIRIAAKVGLILRCLPAEGKTLCETGRFGFTRLGDKLIAALVKKEDLLRRVTLPEAAKAVREGLNVLKAQYGAESIGIAISPKYTNEDISAIAEYAKNIGTPHVFTFAEKPECNTQGLTKHGVSTEAVKYIDMLNSREIRGLIVFGDDLSPKIQTPPEFLVLQTAYTSTLKSPLAKFSNVILPAPAFGEVSGHVENTRTLPVNPAFPPECGFQTREIVKILHASP